MRTNSFKKEKVMLIREDVWKMHKRYRGIEEGQHVLARMKNPIVKTLVT